ncbi:MAG: AAA family ATPase, partial [Alcaligenaceae bacterium]|nr:AAA family ATPase [Alcaligenaceae bacterium]
MRFESIELLRYGHFSDQQLAFPQREHDFHLIVGGNEAGKSTLRQAFRDLLFGIPMNSPMTFLHAGPELALNAVLAGEAGTLAMGRRRKRDGGLVDAAGEKLAPVVLERWLGGVTDAFYERMFGLDHRRLEQGSRAMLQAGDDVDSALFQAAAGLATLNGVLSALREEAAGLWTPHHSRNRAWYAASDRYKEADKLVKAATVRPTTWAEAERESRRTDEAFEQARDTCAELRFMLRDLERRRRLGPLLAQIREHEAMLGRLVTAQGEDSRLLALETDLLAQDETRRRVAGHPAAIAQCESHAGLLREQLSSVLRQLGRQVSANADAAALEQLAAGLPPQPLRHEITQLLNEGRELRAQRQASSQARQARQAEVADIRARAQALPEVAVGQALRRALEAATAAGDLAATLDALKRKVQQEEIELGRRLAALRQPEFAEISVAALQAMAPWPTEALVEQVQQRRDMRAEADVADKRAREAGLELDAAQLKVEQFRRSHQAVSRDEVLAARRERDAVWDALASGQTPLSDQAENFAALLKLADLLADRHLEAVDDAARLQALEHDCERLQAALQGLQRARDEAAARLAAFDEQWRAECAQRRLPAMSPAA